MPTTRHDSRYSRPEHRPFPEPDPEDGVDFTELASEAASLERAAAAWAADEGRVAHDFGTVSPVVAARRLREAVARRGYDPEAVTTDGSGAPAIRILSAAGRPVVPAAVEAAVWAEMEQQQQAGAVA